MANSAADVSRFYRNLGVLGRGYSQLRVRAVGNGRLELLIFAGNGDTPGYTVEIDREQLEDMQTLVRESTGKEKWYDAETPRL